MEFTGKQAKIYPVTHYALSVSIFAAVFVVLFLPRLSETLIERAHRICKDCGLFKPEIDQLIEQMRSSGLTPKESIQLWKDTAEPDAVELCRDCVDAVVGALE